MADEVLKALHDDVSKVNNRLSLDGHEIIRLEKLLVEAQFQVEYRQAQLDKVRERRAALEVVRDEAAKQLQQFVDSRRPADTLAGILQRQAVERVAL